MVEAINNWIDLRDVIMRILSRNFDEELYKIAKTLEIIDLPDDVRAEEAEKLIKKLESYGYKVSDEIKKKLKKAPLLPVLYYPPWYVRVR